MVLCLEREPSLANPTPNSDYLPGWNNQNQQMYDRPGENVDIAFVANITTFSKFAVRRPVLARPIQEREGKQRH